MKPTITSLGGRAPPVRNTRTLSSESHWRVLARDSRARVLSVAVARRWPGPRAVPHLARPGAPSVAASRSCIRASPRWTQSRPTATGARRRARGPSEPRAHVLRESIDSVVPWAPSSQRMGPPTIPVRFILLGGSGMLAEPEHFWLSATGIYVWMLLLSDYMAFPEPW